MLKPIPRKILTDTMTFKAPTGFNVYQEAQYEEFTIEHVHMQNVNDIKFATDNTEVTLSAIIYVDARLSKPRLDYSKMEYEAERIGGTCKATITHRRGAEPGEFTVKTVEAVPDDTGVVHHYEIGVV